VAREQRRLAAIMAADVVGYSRLMGRDEAGTLARLKVHRAACFDPAVARHGGRLVKLTGDGALVEFGSAVDALTAAIEIQQAMAAANADEPDDRRISFRVGLHIGDLIVDGDEVYGDSVNVAARLEGEAPSGGIVLSGNVHDAVTGRLPAVFHDLGLLSLKNIERPVPAFRVTWQAADWPAAIASTQASKPGATVIKAAVHAPTLELPDKPSIAVLPFANMSGDPEQEYFADGISEDIITALSRFRSLFVIARNSSFTYKGKAVDVRTVSRELGVRYVLEGSVRKSGGRVRITGQLVEAETGAHIWAERYDGEVIDIFDLQDKVTADVVGAIGPKLEQAEIERVKRKPTDSPGAYDCYLRGMACYYRSYTDNDGEARRQWKQAIDLDPAFAIPYAMVAVTSAFRKGNGLILDSNEVAETAALACRAVALARDDAVVLSVAGWPLALVSHDLDTAIGIAARALQLNPNLAQAWLTSGWVHLWSGKPDVAIEHFARARRLSPFDPNLRSVANGTAHAYFMTGRYDEALEGVTAEIRESGGGVVPQFRIAAASAAALGRLDEARVFLGRYYAFDPNRRIGNLGDVLGPYRRPEDIERYKSALRLAGLPE
jgi:TolB-like protein/class 3 adenylate cyclase